MKRYHRTWRIVLMAAVLSTAARARAQQQMPPVKPARLVPALGWSIAKQGGFPLSLATDAAGRVWVGTEGNGLWEYDPAAKSWSQFTTRDGLGDDCVYAVAVDGSNRVWAGHLNHGVSVYTGGQWKNHGFIDGPLGDRVFGITISPRDGDVWIATDMGIARYSEQRRAWDYYTRASGLPSDQIQSIAFDDNGRVYAGTQCDGIAIAGPQDDYKKWRTVTAPEPILKVSTGNGLPSNLINQVFCLRIRGIPNSAVSALTPLGGAVAMSADDWTFIHGKDWKQHIPGPYDQGNEPPFLPWEDWMTACQISGNTAWIGFRKSGIESATMADNNLIVHANVDEPDTVVIRAILAQEGQAPLFAAYDGSAGGLLTLDSTNAAKSVAGGEAPATDAPQPAADTVAQDDAKPLVARLGKLTAQISPGEAYYLADDWRTQGDWIGHYGSAYARLCGMGQSGDQEYALCTGYSVSLDVGPHHEDYPLGPAWYHNAKSDDRRILYDPGLGFRLDAEENDASYDKKVYPESYDGPDLWVRVNVPDGVHCMSLYFVNSDAHGKPDNKYRDYDVQVLTGGTDAAKVQASRALARTRVTDFWGGVYKQFLVCGPANYVVRIGRNRSFVTKLQGVFIDRVTGDAPDGGAQLPGYDTVQYGPPDVPNNFQPSKLADSAINLWGQLDDALGLRGAVPLQMPFRIWCYRAATAGQAPEAILERWRWQISVWLPGDRVKFDVAAKTAHATIR